MALQFSLPLSTLLGRARSVFAVEFEERIRSAGLDGMTLSLGINVMRHLSGDNRIRLGVLAEQAGVTKQAISQQVTYLEANGYVVVEPDPDDSRAKTVRLTEKGIGSQMVARPIFSAVERDWEKRFGREDVKDLRRILERILEQLEDTEVVPRRRGAR